MRQIDMNAVCSSALMQQSSKIDSQSALADMITPFLTEQSQGL